MMTIIIIVAIFRCHSPGNGDSNLKFFSAEDFIGIALHAFNVTCNSREADCLHFSWTKKPVWELVIALIYLFFSALLLAFKKEEEREILKERYYTCCCRGVKSISFHLTCIKMCQHST